MNSKIVVLIIIVLSASVFVWLADFGWSHRYGSPQGYQMIEPLLLTVGYRSEDLTLQPDDVFASLWENLPSVELELKHQVTERPWPTGHTEAVKAQAFHNGKDIYFRMTWKDDDPNTSVTLDGFTDGCAVAVPMDANAPVRSIMMGFSSTVNIWHWQAVKDIQYWEGKTELTQAYADFVYPFEQEEILSVSVPELTSAVTDLLAERAGSLTRKRKQIIVQGRGLWRDGTWNVVIKRSLTTDDSKQDCQFAWGNHLAAFAVWDGGQSDRGSRKSISEWVNLQIQPPQPKKSAHKAASGDIAQTENAPRAGASYGERFFSLSLVSSAYGASVEAQPRQAGAKPRLINVQAKRFQYMPNRISVKKGELITIRLESLDVTHGFFLDGYGVNIKARPGLIGKVTFVADKAGRFAFRCSETCGEFHPYMIGFLEVTPNSRFHLFVAGVCIAFVVVLGVLFRKAPPKKGVEENARAE
jgi:cytochrome c oxidase subunit 2